MNEKLQQLEKWLFDTFKVRTEFIENDGVNVDWLDPENRVHLTEICAKADELGITMHKLDLCLWQQSFYNKLIRPRTRKSTKKWGRPS